VTAGMPPARETTSGRLTTENSARISDVFMPCVRAAYRSASGSSRGWPGAGGRPLRRGEGSPSSGAPVGGRTQGCRARLSYHPRV
jgi:hypothetical protein